MQSIILLIEEAFLKLSLDRPLLVNLISYRVQGSMVNLLLTAVKENKDFNEMSAASMSFTKDSHDDTAYHKEAAGRYTQASTADIIFLL